MIKRPLTLLTVVINEVHLRFSISSTVDEFTLKGTFMADSPSDDVYLFLFQPTVDNSGGHLAIHLPPESATYYWAYDPLGLQRLPEEIIDELGLPTVELKVSIWAASWGREYYNVIQKRHSAKGFDPDSQDVAIKLEYPLVDVDRLNLLINGKKVRILVVDGMYTDCLSRLKRSMMLNKPSA